MLLLLKHHAGNKAYPGVQSLPWASSAAPLVL